MPNETQDLVFNLKANTGNAEQGMARVGKLTDDLKITTEKTSGALREFGNQLKSARDLSDVAGMATKALGQVLGASLGGTAVLVAGKALFDAFNAVQVAVKDTENKVKDAFKEIDKAGLPRTFEESANQANKLVAAADSVKKKVEEIESNPLQKFIAGITGAKEKMDELAASTSKAAIERLKLGAQTAIADEEFQRGLSDKEKALNDLYQSFESKKNALTTSMLTAGAKPEDIKPLIDQISNLHTQARDKMLADYANKEYAVEEQNARKASDLHREYLMGEYELEQKSNDRLREAERARGKEQLDAIIEENKKREEGAKLIEEYHKRLFDITEKRIALEEKLAGQREKLAETSAKIAGGAIGMGGTARGPGQRPTSYELGANKAAERAAQQARYQDFEAYKQQIQDKLLQKKFEDQGKEAPRGLTKAEKNVLISPEAVKNEMARLKVEQERTKAVENGTALLEKQSEAVQKTQAELDYLAEATQIMSEEQGNATGAVKDFTESVKAATGAMTPTGAGAGAPQTTLTDVYRLLDEVLSDLVDISKEIATYAHAT